MYGITEVQLYGRHSNLVETDGLVIRQSVGAYGTLWEIECRSLWHLWRLPAILADLPPGALYLPLPGFLDDDPDDRAVVLHYWKGGMHYATTGGTSPGTQIRKSTQ